MMHSARVIRQLKVHVKCVIDAVRAAALIRLVSKNTCSCTQHHIRAPLPRGICAIQKAAIAIAHAGV